MRAEASELDRLIASIRGCRHCVETPSGKPLPHEPRPVLRVSETARLDAELLMAHALGGRVDYLPGGREIGTMLIQVAEQARHDPVAAALPVAFRAHTTHEQSVLELPKGATVLAGSARDPHHLLRYGKNAVSVQFHPEFNADVMRAYIHRKRADMHREGFDPHHTFRQVAPTPIARRLLRHFSRHHGMAAYR